MAVRLIFIAEGRVVERDFPTGHSINRDSQRGYILRDKEDKILAVVGPENFLLIERMNDAEDPSR